MVIYSQTQLIAGLKRRGKEHFVMKPRGSLFVLLLAVSGLVFIGGCVSKSQYDTCQRHNDILNERLSELIANQEALRLEAETWKQKYEQLAGLRDIDQKALLALQESLAAKQALIEQLTNKISQTALPPELSDALAKWAQESGSDLVTYDEKTGVVRFKSDLVFASGSDVVQPEAQKQILALAQILVSPAAQAFDILVVGHTDDQPIRHSAAKHPTNWHLSAHRAISVENILAQSSAGAPGLAEKRMAVMGMSSFRPIAPNEPDNRGNAKNRRVEIYIVPAGQIRIAGQVNPGTNPTPNTNTDANTDTNLNPNP